MEKMLQRVGVLQLGIGSDTDSSLRWEAAMREPGAADRWGPDFQRQWAMGGRGEVAGGVEIDFPVCTRSVEEVQEQTGAST